MAAVAGATGVAAINTGAAVLGKGIGSGAGVILGVVPIRCGGGGWLGGFGDSVGETDRKRKREGEVDG